MKKRFILPSLLGGIILSTTLCFAEPMSSGIDRNSEIKDEMKRVFTHISNELQAGREVKIRSFGTFYAKQRAARAGRNPKTGEKIAIPAKRYPRFRSSDVLKRSLNSL